MGSYILRETEFNIDLDFVLGKLEGSIKELGYGVEIKDENNIDKVGGRG